MFLFKMLLLLKVSGKEVMISSVTEGLYRVSGEVHSANVSIAPSVSSGSRLSGAIWHNLACLYPAKSGLMESGGVWLLTIFILIIGFSSVYLLHDRIEWSIFLPLMMPAVEARADDEPANYYLIGFYLGMMRYCVKERKR